MVENKFGTLKNFNRPLFFNGLSPIQIIIMFFALVIGFVAFQFYALLLIVPISMYGSWVSKRTKQGCPNVVESFMVWSSTKRRFIDDGIFKNLKINESARNIK